MAPSFWVLPLPPVIKGVKGKATNPNNRSFLDFCPELRNKIYERLLVFSDSLKVAIRAQDGKVHLYHQINDVNQHRFAADGDLRLTSLAHVELNSLECVRNEDGSLVCVYIPAFALLYTCRQIYYEAATIFYRSNSFTTTHVNRVVTLVGHPFLFSGSAEYRFHDKEGKAFLAFGNWTKVLGSQTNFVNKVIIGLETLCFSQCPNRSHWTNAIKECSGELAHRMLDVAPLLFAHWSCGRSFKVSIVCGNPRGPEPPHLGCSIWASTQTLSDEFDIGRLNDTVNRLLKDELNIKRFKTLIGRVGVLRSGEGGVVLFNTTSNIHVTTRTNEDAACAACMCVANCDWVIDRQTQYHACPHASLEFSM